MRCVFLAASAKIWPFCVKAIWHQQRAAAAFWPALICLLHKSEVKLKLLEPQLWPGWTISHLSNKNVAHWHTGTLGMLFFFPLTCFVWRHKTSQHCGRRKELLERFVQIPLKKRPELQSNPDRLHQVNPWPLGIRVNNMSYLCWPIDVAIFPLLRIECPGGQSIVIPGINYSNVHSLFVYSCGNSPRHSKSLDS